MLNIKDNKIILPWTSEDLLELTQNEVNKSLFDFTIYTSNSDVTKLKILEAVKAYYDPKLKLYFKAEPYLPSYEYDLEFTLANLNSKVNFNPLQLPKNKLGVISLKVVIYSISKKENVYKIIGMSRTY